MRGPRRGAFERRGIADGGTARTAFDGMPGDPKAFPHCEDSPAVRAVSAAPGNGRAGIAGAAERRCGPGQVPLRRARDRPGTAAGMRWRDAWPGQDDTRAPRERLRARSGKGARGVAIPPAPDVPPPAHPARPDPPRGAVIRSARPAERLSGHGHDGGRPTDGPLICEATAQGPARAPARGVAGCRPSEDRPMTDARRSAPTAAAPCARPPAPGAACGPPSATGGGRPRRGASGPRTASRHTCRTGSRTGRCTGSRTGRRIALA